MKKINLLIVMLLCLSVIVLSGCAPGAIVNGYNVSEQTKVSAGSFASIPYNSTTNPGKTWYQYSGPYWSASSPTGTAFSHTQYLHLSNFGFNIPSNAVITGVMLQFTSVSSAVNPTTGYDNAIYLSNSGVPISTNMKKTGALFDNGYSASEPLLSYGGYNNLWGTNLTPAMINSPSFGLMLAFGVNIDPSLTSSVSIRRFNYSSSVSGPSGLTVYYYVPAAACVPTTCAAQGKNCGSISNGCGGTLTCGSCAVGTVCNNNVCASGTQCTNDCTTSGSKQCSGSSVQTCGNFDTDTCLEWGNTTACGTGTTCSSGVCISTTVNPIIGNGTGLKAEYYGYSDLTDIRVAKVDSKIDFGAWVSDASPIPNVPGKYWSVRWTGQVQPKYSGTYYFSTVTDDGARLYINGQLVIDKWINQGATRWNSTGIAMTAGQKYDIKMEYYQAGYSQSAKLYWWSAQNTYEIIPTTQLYPAAITQICTAGAKTCGGTGTTKVCNLDGLSYTATVCASGLTCSVSTSTCVQCTTNSQCNDKNDCTVDSCNSGFCTNNMPDKYCGKTCEIYEKLDNGKCNIDYNVLTTTEGFKAYYEKNIFSFYVFSLSIIAIIAGLVWLIAKAAKKK